MIFILTHSTQNFPLAILGDGSLHHAEENGVAGCFN